LPWVGEGMLHWVLKNVFFILVVAVGYRFFHWMLRFAWFERITMLTSLTRFKFWNRYKESKRY
jgi:hypothetical protein